MKRGLLTAAAIGTSMLALAQASMAKDCSGAGPATGDTMECRKVAASALGDHFCLVPDNFGIRAIKRATRQESSDDPWVTKYPIELEDVRSQIHPAKASPCRPGSLFAGSKLNISKATGGHGYSVQFTAPNQTTKTLNMSVTSDDHGNEVWLTGYEGSMHYFVFLRDKPDLDHVDVPKFALVEVFDWDDNGCKNEAPVLNTRTVASHRCAAKSSTAMQEGMIFETVVAGGGERP